MEKNILLQQFENKILLYDGMLIETGGLFGKGKLGGDKYVDLCFDIAKEFLNESNQLEELLNIMTRFINEYKEQNDWKYYNLEMAFLNELNDRISTLRSY
ncbi:MAG: hypothetical protein QM644_19235 [Mobilitalea sp.]